MAGKEYSVDCETGRNGNRGSASYGAWHKVNLTFSKPVFHHCCFLSKEGIPCHARRETVRWSSIRLVSKMGEERTTNTREKQHSFFSGRNHIGNGESSRN